MWTIISLLCSPTPPPTTNSRLLMIGLKMKGNVFPSRRPHFPNIRNLHILGLFHSKPDIQWIVLSTESFFRYICELRYSKNNTELLVHNYLTFFILSILFQQSSPNQKVKDLTLFSPCHSNPHQNLPERGVLQNWNLKMNSYTIYIHMFSGTDSLNPTLI